MIILVKVYQDRTGQRTEQNIVSKVELEFEMPLQVSTVTKPALDFILRDRREHRLPENLMQA